jgi:hypothetical protein
LQDIHHSVFETRDRRDEKRRLSMKKRLASLVVLALVLAAITPAAMADHCRKCRQIDQKCTIAASGGFPACDDAGGVCITSGALCTGPHPLVEEPLASAYTVVSVERLDEPAAPPQTRVASLQTAPIAHR